jgi:hypothetical protein
MKKTQKFIISKKRYALKIDEIELIKTSNGRMKVYAPAVWFKKINGRINACIGYLWDCSGEENAKEWVENFSDGRHGGSLIAKFDGENYWGEQNIKKQKEYIEILSKMLKNYPEIPDGYDGWYTF